MTLQSRLDYPVPPHEKDCALTGAWFPKVLALLLLCGLLSAESVAGSVVGKVVFAGPAPAPQKVPITIDQYLCGNERMADDLQLSANREIRNAVVWIDNPPAGAPAPPARKVEVDQKGCTFVPRVVVVPAGGTVDFLNSDRLLHNIHATPKRNVSFNRTQPMGRTIPVTFAEPEIVRIDCDLHAWMMAWVVVAPHAFYVVTGADGRFAFDNLPPGQYKLQVWHEKLGTVPASVTVGDQPAQMTVELKPK
ncbi:carboxypeptidase regulatory-like domain-containing protein [Variovorax sp. J22R133]|uniref:carboxypeptidase regulatory-like domain-containing protein n=1 Tax=Variovorax brevis TaxID=3053503 RepID=UPI00257714CE|nr:carboxypeptidase regulatory-like domain-containing protein [Variovorax sp. J22R133]MDM0116562.1 carboxypeptidase regulatory-like domain-containing protein [Variovorax sp. J22R133]